MKYIKYIVIGLLVALVTVALAQTVQRAPHAPMAPGVKNPGVATKKHWRLVAEGEQNGQALLRKPLNAVRYNSADACAKDGTKLPPPPARIAEKNVNFLIRCLPYTTLDTDKETPIGGEVIE